MIRKSALAVLFLFISQFSLTTNAFCWPSPKSVSLQPYFGYYKVPGKLFEMDGSIVTHPQHLIGSMNGARGSLNWNYYSFEVDYFQAEAHGSGQWARSDTADILAANGVTGVITGKTYWRLKGVTANIERRFWDPKSPVRPYVLVGGGLAEVAMDFDGSFDGHETMSGFDFPVNELASDRIKRNIPIFLAEAGLRFNLGEHFYWALSGYWNTGYGTKLGLGIKLP